MYATPRPPHIVTEIRVGREKLFLSLDTRPVMSSDFEKTCTCKGEGEESQRKMGHGLSISLWCDIVKKVLALCGEGTLR